LRRRAEAAVVKVAMVVEKCSAPYGTITAYSRLHKAATCTAVVQQTRATDSGHSGMLISYGPTRV
jgi:hypothetical protein